MGTNRPPSDKLLLEAVELRIGGFKWEVVAEKLKRSFETIRKWPMRYPDRWEAAIERAEKRLTVDSNAESVVVLRNMLRADDIKMRWHAAKTLVGLRIDLGKLGLRLMAARAVSGQLPDPNADEDYRLFQFLRQRSDRELAERAEAIRPSLTFATPAAPLDPSGQVDESAECDRPSTCVADSAALDQVDPQPATENAGNQGEIR